jgi:hypothetical protein
MGLYRPCHFQQRHGLRLALGFGSWADRLDALALLLPLRQRGTTERQGCQQKAG